MSISVSRLTSLWMFHTLLSVGILGPQLFAQQAPAQSSPRNATRALTASSQVLPGKTRPALTVSGNVSSTVASAKTDVAGRNKAQLQYLHLPLAFEKNQGQADAHVKFLSRGAGYGLFLTDREAVLSFGGQKPSSVKLRFLSSESKSTVDATDRLPGTSNYFLGNDRTKWHTNVPNFGRVEYKNLYSGIDLVYYGNQQKIEHDFVVAPHSDPAKIRFAIDGAKKLALEKSGDIVVTTSSGELRLRKPAIYQTVNGARKEIAGGYALQHGNEVSFVLGSYDRERELTIDPVLILSTYLADAAGVTVTGVASDSTGIYVTGYTQATSFGITPTLPSSSTGDDVFVAKLDAAGNQLLYSAFIGGSGTDRATGLAVNSQNAYVTGYTSSTAAGAGTAFPTTASAFQTDLQGTATQAAFVLKLKNDGTALDYSSYYGPTADNTARANAVAVNGGFIYIAGSTDSANLPTPGTPFQDGTTHVASTQSGFFAQFDPAAVSSLPYATYIAGSAGNIIANAISVTGATNVYVAGQFDDKLPKEGSAELPTAGGNDGFVLQFDPTNATASAQLTKATQIGGTQDETVAAIAADGVTGVYVAGQTHSSGLATGTPFNSTLAGAGDAFVARLDSTGVLNYFSYIGGSGVDSASSIAFDGTNIYVAGTTASNDLTLVNPLQIARNGLTDGFVAKVNPAGGGTSDLLYLTYFGGSGDEQINAVSLNGNGSAVIIAGTSTSADLNTTASAFQPAATAGNNSFVASLDAAAPNGSALSVTTLALPSYIRSDSTTQQTFSYQFTITNTGSADAHNVVFNDFVPGGGTPLVTFAATTVTPPVGTCTQRTAGGVTCALGTLAASASVKVTILATPNNIAAAEFPVATTIDDPATISSAETTPQTVSASVKIQPETHLSASFFNPPASPAKDGDPLTYTIQVTNAGPAALPAGAAQLAGTIAGPGVMLAGALLDLNCQTGSSFNAGTGAYICILPALPIGPTTITITGIAHVAAGITRTLTASAALNPAQASDSSNEYFDIGGFPASATPISVDVQPQADLLVTITPPTATFDGATGVAYSVTVINNSGSLAGDLAGGAAQVSGTFAGADAGFTITSVPVGCSSTATTFACPVGALQHGASQPFVIMGSASITNPNGGNRSFMLSTSVAPTQNVNTTDNYFETNATNNTATVTTTVVPTTDLQATTFSGPTTVQDGTLGSYTIVVTNNGTTANNDLNAGLAQVSGTFTGAHPGTTFTITGISGCNATGTTFSGGDYTCPLPTITNQSGGSPTATITITGTFGVTQGITDTISGTATVSPITTGGVPGYNDSNTANDAAAPVTTNVQPIANLVASLIAPPAGPVHEGQTVTYTIQVRNAAATTPTNDLSTGAAQITGTLRNGSNSYISITAVTGCSTAPLVSGSNNDTFTCVLPAIAGNNGVLSAPIQVMGTAHVTTKAKDTLTVTVTPGPTVNGSAVANYFDSPGPVPAMTTLDVQPATHLIASFTASQPGPVKEGDPVSYTVQVTNAGAASPANDLAAGAAQVTGTLNNAANSFVTITSVTGCNSAPSISGANNDQFTCILPALSGANGTLSTPLVITGTAHVRTGIKDTLTATVTPGPTTGTNGNPNYFDNGSSGPTPTSTTLDVQPVTHLVASFTATQASPVKEGSAVSYTVQVTNAGPANPGNNLASGAAQLLGTLNNGTNSFITITSVTGCSSAAVITGANNDQFSCVLPAITGNNGTAAVVITGTAHVTTGIKNTLTVTVTPAPTVGTNTNNNYVDTSSPTPASRTLDVQPATHLAASFTASQASPVKEGDPVSYTVQVINAGAASPANDLAAAAAQIGATLNNGASSFVTITSVTGCNGAPSITGANSDQFTCVLPAIPGANGTLSLVITGTAHVRTKIKDTLTATVTPSPTIGSGGNPNYFDTGASGPTPTSASLDVQPVTHLIASFTATQAGPVQEGQSVTYTVQVTNAGVASPANDLAIGAAQLTGTLNDATNSYVTISSITGCNGIPAITGANGDQFTCVLPATSGNNGTLAAPIVITGIAHVTTGTKDTLTVAVAPGPTIGTGGNSNYVDMPGPTSASRTLDVQPKTHLSTAIARTTPAVVKEGDTVSYTIHVASSTMSLAANAGVIGGTFVGSGSPLAPNSTLSGMALANCVSFTVDTPNPGNFTCVLPAVSVATGADIIVSGTAHVITGIQDTLTGSTTAAPNGNNYFETQPVATSSNAPATVIRPATDLQPSIPTAPATLQNGQTTSYVVQVTNNGLTPANNLAPGAAKVLIAFTGTNSSFAITTAPGCTTISGSSVSCVLGALNAGQSQQFTITGTVSLNSGSSDTLTLTATVSPNNGNDYFDSNSLNDTTTAARSIKGVSNLALSFTGSATPVLVGNNLTYGITVSNASAASTAAGVNVTVPLGATGQTFVPASSSSNCSIQPADVAANIVTCQIGNAGVVPAGSSFTASVVVLASPAAVPNSAAGTPRQSTYAQSATVNVDAAQTVNSNAGNSTQNVNSTFQAAAHITVAHTNSIAPALIDGAGTTYNNVVYTTTVTNVAGRSDAKNVAITDNPPIGPNVTFVSATVTGGSCSGSGPVTCSIPLLASGNTATVTTTVRPVRLANVPPVSIADTTSYTPSDVTDPTPNPSDTTNTSTIPVHNTISGGTLPLQDTSSQRLATLFFGTVNQTGVTSFTTSSLSGVTLDSRYPLAAQPGTSLLYNFHTTASISGPVSFCFTPVQNFLKPERVRVFLISGGGSTDITSSISPAAPNRGTGVTQVCGSTPFVSDVSLAVLEPKNNPPVLQFVFNPSSAGKGVTGSFVDLNASGSFDPDVNPCNGNLTSCSDTPQLRFYFFFIPFSGSVSTTAANPVVTASLPSGTTSIVVAAVDQTVPVPSVVNTPDDLKNLPNAQTGLTISSFSASTDSTGGTVNSTTQTILAGQSTSFSFRPTTPTGAPLQGNAVLTFSCSNGSTTPNLDSAGIKCAINPPTFDISSSSTVVLLISTTGTTLGKAQPAPGAPLYAAWIAFAGMPFAGIVIISVSRRRWLKLLLAFGLLVVAIGSQVACGGGGGGMKPTTSFATPRGNYEIVVTGTQNGTALSKNSFTITVQ